MYVRGRLSPLLKRTEKMIENKIIKEKINNIYSSFYSNDYCSQFFFKTILHHVISLEVFENNNDNGISFEKLCSKIPNAIGSRSSIQSILTHALERKIFIKKESLVDKRVKNYFLSNNYFDLINSWIKKEQIYFTHTNGENFEN